MRLGRDTRPGRELARPGRGSSTLTGRDSRRGHDGQSSRRKSATSTRITVNYKAAKEDMDTTSKRKSSKNTKAYLKHQRLEDIRLEDKNKIENILLWLPDFNKTIRLCTGSRNYLHLEQLLLFYTQNILSSVDGNSVKLNDEVNFKNHINKMLMFFHFYWLDIKQDVTDHSQYLNKVSALLNVYINMELKTSMEEGTSSHIINSSEIAAKIIAALYIYLNNSEEHIFRVLLRIKYTTEKYAKVCNHIFMKSFTNLKTKRHRGKISNQMTSITDVAYIRYLLVFKMWKKMEETTKDKTKRTFLLFERKEKNYKLALIEELLGPRMPKLQDKLLKFVPRPVGQENETLWLIQSDLFGEQVHQQFLLFEDKMDNCNKNLQYTKNHQTTLLFHQSNTNEDTSQQKIKYLSGVRNNNTLPNNENKTLDNIYVQKEGSKSLGSVKKIKKKVRKPVITIDSTGTEIIDLTEDDEISKVKRKRTKQNSKCLKIIKNIMKSKKHINSPKYSNKFINSNVTECSNESKKITGEKIRLESKPIYDVKISDSTENCTPVSSKSSLNDLYHNIQKSEHPHITKNQINNTCMEFAKEDEKQPDYNLHCLKSPIFVDQNINGFKVTAKESKLENCVSLCVTIGNATSSYNNSVTQNKEMLTSQEDSAMETIPLFKRCQNNIADQHSFKKESPTSTNCSTMQKSHKCNAMPVDDITHDITHTIKISKSINDLRPQITRTQTWTRTQTRTRTRTQMRTGTGTRTRTRTRTQTRRKQTEIITQEICEVDECPHCRKIDCKPLLTNNVMNTASKAQETLRVMTEQCLDKSNDTCTVSTTFTEDEIGETPLHNHVNFDNARVNDYYNTAKYSDTAIKEQQKRTDCDSSILSDRLHSSDTAFDINTFDIVSNAEVEYNLKSFPKTEEADEITKNDYDYLENINFSNNMQNEEDLLKDLFWQSSEQPQINYDSLTDVPAKKPFIYTDNDLITVKTQDILHNIYANENVETSQDTNMPNDHVKCSYVPNHTGKHVASAEEKNKYLNNSNDMCTVSTTFTGDQIIESPLDGQYINSGSRRKCDYKDVLKNSNDTMEEQLGRNNCDTSMSDELHSSEFYVSDMDPFEINSTEASEIMKTDFINDFENISFLHNNLEDILSNDTTNFLLPLKTFDDDVYTDLSNEKNVLCNNQNDSSIDLASHLSDDDTFLRLPAKSDKLVYGNFDTLLDKLNNDALTVFGCKKIDVEGIHILEESVQSKSIF